MSQYMKVSKEDELTHWGVLGMKWGVRKDRHGSGSGGLGPRTKKIANKIMELNGTKPRKRTKEQIELRDAKLRKKKAYKDFSKAYDKYTSNPFNMFTKKGDEKYRDMDMKLDVYLSEKENYRKIKRGQDEVKRLLKQNSN